MNRQGRTVCFSTVTAVSNCDICVPPSNYPTNCWCNAALKGISLRQFFIQAIQYTLAPEKHKVRKAPPAIGDTNAPRIKSLTREQIDEAMFG
jgi:hypothetical protein